MDPCGRGLQELRESYAVLKMCIVRVLSRKRRSDLVSDLSYL